jgi:hypothetical protein
VFALAIPARVRAGSHNVTDGKLIPLFVVDEPFDMRDGELRTTRRRQ